MGKKKTTCTSTSLCDQAKPAGHQIQWKYFVPELDANPNDPGINFARQTQPTVIPAASINPTDDAVFNTGTPLIYYVLAEAKKANAVLGYLGKSIVAQTFIQVMWDTPNSILHSSFRPNPSLVKLAPETPRFSFGDLLVDTGLAPRSS
jgi:hypothetical protein